MMHHMRNEQIVEVADNPSIDVDALSAGRALSLLSSAPLRRLRLAIHERAQESKELSPIMMRAVSSIRQFLCETSAVALRVMEAPLCDEIGELHTRLRRVKDRTEAKDLKTQLKKRLVLLEWIFITTPPVAIEKHVQERLDMKDRPALLRFITVLSLLLTPTIPPTTRCNAEEASCPALRSSAILRILAPCIPSLVTCVDLHGGPMQSQLEMSILSLINRMFQLIINLSLHATFSVKMDGQAVEHHDTCNTRSRFQDIARKLLPSYAKMCRLLADESNAPLLSNVLNVLAVSLQTPHDELPHILVVLSFATPWLLKHLGKHTGLEGSEITEHFMYWLDYLKVTDSNDENRTGDTDVLKGFSRGHALVMLSFISGNLSPAQASTIFMQWDEGTWHLYIAALTSSMNEEHGTCEILASQLLRYWMLCAAKVEVTDNSVEIPIVLKTVSQLIPLENATRNACVVSIVKDMLGVFPLVQVEPLIMHFLQATTSPAVLSSLCSVVLMNADAWYCHSSKEGLAVYILTWLLKSQSKIENWPRCLKEVWVHVPLHVSIQLLSDNTIVDSITARNCIHEILTSAFSNQEKVATDEKACINNIHAVCISIMSQMKQPILSPPRRKVLQPADILELYSVSEPVTDEKAIQTRLDELSSAGAAWFVTHLSEEDSVQLAMSLQQYSAGRPDDTACVRFLARTMPSMMRHQMVLDKYFTTLAGRLRTLVDASSAKSGEMQYLFQVLHPLLLLKLLPLKCWTNISESLLTLTVDAMLHCVTTLDAKQYQQVRQVCGELISRCPTATLGQRIRDELMITLEEKNWDMTKLILFAHCQHITRLLTSTTSLDENIASRYVILVKDVAIQLLELTDEWMYDDLHRVRMATIDANAVLVAADMACTSTSKQPFGVVPMLMNRLTIPSAISVLARTAGLVSTLKMSKQISEMAITTLQQAIAHVQAHANEASYVKTMKLLEKM